MAETKAVRAFSAGDVSGGLASAVVSIPGNVAAGVIAFAPLGPDFVGQGILAGMLSSIVGGFLSSLTGGAPGMIAGPKATTSMVFAAMLSSLLATGVFDLTDPESAQVLLSLAYGAVLLSGSVQLLLGAFRIGGLVRFMPYPVVSGIRNTTAILLIYSQFWVFFGVQRQSWGEFFSNLGQIQPATALVAATTALIVWKGGRLMPKPIVPVVALLVGSGLYYLLNQLIPGVRLGDVLGQLPPAIPTPRYATGLIGALTDPSNAPLLLAVLSGALAMAVLDSISALITLVSYQSIADRRFDANRQLMGQGIGSAVGSLFGSLTTSGILARAAVNHGAGGRSRLSGVVNGLSVLVLLAVLARPLGLIPKAALAGLIIVIAWGLFDRWILGQAREAVRSEATGRRDNVIAVVQMLFVVLVGVFVNLVAAVGAGVALSVLVFVAEMSRSPIRRIRSGTSIRSVKMRDSQTMQILEEKGHRIAVIELEGTIFFGSCDALATEAESLAEDGADFVIFDMKRVRSVDATGFKVFGQTFARLRRKGVTLGFSYVMPGQIRAEIAEDLQLNGVPDARMFVSTDRALEYFEDGLLMKLGADEFDEDGWSLDDFGRDWGLDEAERAILPEYIRERSFEGGEYVFREGDTDRSLFLVRLGGVDLTLPVPGDVRRHRLRSVSRGTILGELALLDGLARGAAAQATGPVLVYELDYESFIRLRRDHPVLAMKLQTGIGSVMSARLRSANALIMELED